MAEADQGRYLGFPSFNVSDAPEAVMKERGTGSAVANLLPNCLACAQRKSERSLRSQLP
jgi:hypothetical protein